MKIQRMDVWIDVFIMDRLPWGNKIEISKKIANVVTYLHIKFPWPIIHRDEKKKKNPANIFLGQHHASKLFNFIFAMSSNEGESRVGLDDLAGTGFHRS